MGPREDWQRANHQRLTFVIGTYLHRGLPYEWRSHSGGDGTGTDYGQIRFVVDMDAAQFWSLWTEIATKKGWKP